MSYGRPNFSDLFRRAGDMVNKILRGTKPAQSTEFEMVINLRAVRRGPNADESPTS
jgi:hypothetical protein